MIQSTALLTFTAPIERQMMKTCSKCKVKKEPSEFNIRRASKDGLCSQCRECSRKSLRTYQKTEKGKEARHKYRQTKAGKEVLQRADQRYRQTENGKKSHSVGCQKYNLLYPEKRRAHAAVAYALETGKITRPFACEICFSICKPESHHEDYSRPLEVDWLCIECHSKQGVKV